MIPESPRLPRTHPKIIKCISSANLLRLVIEQMAGGKQDKPQGNPIPEVETGEIVPVTTNDAVLNEELDLGKDLAGHANYHGIDTTQVQPGADAVYEAKISILNEALIDIGMGPFQWKMFMMTGFGWFLDQVRNFPQYEQCEEQIINIRD